MAARPVERILEDRKEDMLDCKVAAVLRHILGTHYMGWPLEGDFQMAVLSRTVSYSASAGSASSSSSVCMLE